MSQFDFGVIDPEVRDGTWLADSLNQWRDALYSMMSGGTAPSFAVDGILWRDTAGGENNTIVKQRHSATWRNLWTINHATGLVTFANTLPLSGGTVTGTLQVNGPFLFGTGGGLGVAGVTGARFLWNPAIPGWIWDVADVTRMSLAAAGLNVFAGIQGQRVSVVKDFASIDAISTGTGSASEINLQNDVSSACKMNTFLNTWGVFRATRTTFAYEAQMLILDLNTGHLTATGDVTAFSDGRIKKDIRPITNALAIVEKLKGVAFTRMDTGEPGVGLIAQEVREVIPEVVRETQDERKTLTVAYGNLVGVLIEAVKELNARVLELEAKAGH
jgi:hypothetical protein